MSEFAGFDPTQVRDLEWFRLALNDGAAEEMKPDGSRWVGMFNREAFVFDADPQAELFANFTRECGLERFVFFNFAAREFPVPWKVNVVEASCDENLVRAANDCGDDRYCHERSAAAWRYGRKSSRHLLRRRKSMKRRYSAPLRFNIDAMPL